MAANPYIAGKVTLSVGVRHLAMLDELAVAKGKSEAVRILIERAYYESKGARLAPKEQG